MTTTSPVDARRASIPPLLLLSLRHFPLLFAAALLVGCGASGTLTPIESEPTVSIKSVPVIPEEVPSGSVNINWVKQGVNFLGARVQQLPDSRLMVAYPEDADDEQTPYVIKMFSPALDQLWSVKKVFGPGLALIAMTAENDKAHILAMKYNEEADVDSVRLMRASFSADGRFLSCDTLARTRGTWEVDNNSDSGYLGYRVLRSPDSSKTLVYQAYYQYEHNVTKGKLNFFVFDRSFNVLYGRVVEFPVSSYELEPDPDDWEGPLAPASVSVDNDGGVYVVSVEAGTALNVSYYPDRDGVPRAGRYKFDRAPFRTLYDSDVEDMTLSTLLPAVVDDKLLVTTRIQEEKKWLGQVYGVVAVEFPRATMEPKVQIAHAFNEAFAERLADDDEAEGMVMIAAVPMADGSLVTCFQHVDYKTYTVGKGFNARTVSITVVDRFGVIHYGADGKPKWVGSIDDDYYGATAEETSSSDLAAREFVRNENTIDLVHNFMDDHELRTISFDASRDTIIVGHSLAELDRGQLIPRTSMVWSSPSRLVVLVPSGQAIEYTLNLIETSDGKPLFSPRKLDD